MPWITLFLHSPEASLELPALLLASLPHAALMKHLANTEITGLCDRCQKRTVTWIWGTGYPTKEQDYIDKAVVALMALQTDEPIRAAKGQRPFSRPPRLPLSPPTSTS
ncbi:hypothetical protein DFH08DRAFT_978904 [Mycena albidolilacea]|uniref:Uncharacterized protein n=1 Tax=Mycena albidolilacea TaxID=1033008 RepID=A0AAD6YXN3_9AGAR|nr:hypothetical protein DFH08DRAFT_978904 [Mycena albidolilacea]